MTKHDIVFMNHLITEAFDLLRFHTPDKVDKWFATELGELKLKEYNDIAFMEDWREQRRIEVYDLMSMVQKACYRSLDEFVVREEQRSDR